ncbi:MAG: radical SAM protein [Phycisphaerales bacterium]
MLKEQSTLNVAEVAVTPGDSRFEELIQDRLSELFPKRCIGKVLFVVPPEGDESMFDYATAKRGRYSNHPPYGVAVIASHLRRRGIEVHILNLHHEVLKRCRQSGCPEDFDFRSTWETALSDELDLFEPDMVGLTCMFTQTHRSAVQVAREVKRLVPNMPLSLGGVHITNCFASRGQFGHVIGEYAVVDLFFFHEAELAFVEFVRAVNGETPGSGVYQAYSNTGSVSIHFAGRKTPSDEDLNIVPAQDLMQVEELSRYGSIGSFFCLKEREVRVATVLSNRGCRGNCTYCSVRNFNGSGVRHKSIEVLIEEMLSLRQRGVEHIMWLDDDLFFDHRRAIGLFNEMVRRDVGLTWDCTNGVVAASCTEELIAAAVESGCIGLNVGIESGNSEILKSVRKPSGIAQFMKAAEVFKKHEGLNTRGFLMVGFPEETYRMVLDTCNLAVNMDLDWYNITILQPLPNTPISDTMARQGLIPATDTKEVRFNSGSFGKRGESVARERLTSPARVDPFENADLDTVPPKSAHESIWLYMNVRLNFWRLFSLRSEPKLDQQRKYLRHITEVVAPDDPFPLYFYSYLQYRLHGATDERLVDRLERRLASSPYWSDLFTRFGLSPDHLRTGQFPQ